MIVASYARGRELVSNLPKIEYGKKRFEPTVRKSITLFNNPRAVSENEFISGFGYRAKEFSDLDLTVRPRQTGVMSLTTFNNLGTLFGVPNPTEMPGSDLRPREEEQ